MLVSLVDYGVGNLGSVANMLKRVGAPSRRISTPEEIMESEKVLLPGIGAFDTAMSRLAGDGLIEPLQAYARSGRPLLGICLGMQLLLDGSEEGTLAGLGLIPGTSKRFAEDAGLPIPHMGWNVVTPTREDPLVDGLEPESRFYFVHSYRVVPDSADDVLGTADYGTPFTAMVRAGNVMGAQFHPEKSHTFGMTILTNFAAL